MCVGSLFNLTRQNEIKSASVKMGSEFEKCGCENYAHRQIAAVSLIKSLILSTESRFMRLTYVRIVSFERIFRLFSFLTRRNDGFKKYFTVRLFSSSFLAVDCSFVDLVFSPFFCIFKGSKSMRSLIFRTKKIWK